LLVAKQRLGSESCAHHCLFRQPGCAPTLLTSTSRTARCGPACRVVWQGCSLLATPYADYAGASTPFVARTAFAALARVSSVTAGCAY
jgi:hypothetical protein